MKAGRARARVCGVVVLLAVACNRTPEAPRADEPAEAARTSDAIVVPVNVPPTTIAAADAPYAEFFPATLCSMQRADLRQVLHVTTARYEAGDAQLHVNIGDVEDLGTARALYQNEYKRVVSGPWGVFTRSWTLDNGEHNDEACIVLRDTVNVCVDAASMREPPNAVECLKQIDLARLVQRAADAGAASGLADLSFTYTDEDWTKHETSLAPGYSEYRRACELHAAGKSGAAAEALTRAGRAGSIESECQLLEETRRDCKADLFDERMTETDIHLTAHELANFRRTWEITCKLALLKR